MRKKSGRKQPYFTVKSAMTAILRDASGRCIMGSMGYYSLVERESAWSQATSCANHAPIDCRARPSAPIEM